MYEVDDLFEEVGMRPAVADGILHTAVDIDCHDNFSAIAVMIQ